MVPRRDGSRKYVQLRGLEVSGQEVPSTEASKLQVYVRRSVTDSDDPPAVPDPEQGALSREDAVALRESLDPAERERVEATVASLLDLLGKTHAMAVLSAFAFADGPLRFSDLESHLDAAPNTLSTRLQEFTDAGLLDREAHDEVPPRVEYTPTEKAESLFPVFGHLHHWAIDHEL
jgi:DNA-binding HxlR family transcriptional regulator